MIKTAVIGASGYTGIELVRYVLGHPAFELTLATSDGNAGQAIAELYPSFVGQTPLVFSRHDIDAVKSSCALAFLAVPHTTALELAAELLAAGVSVIDLSADFRLTDAAIYQQWYGLEHSAPDLLGQAVYGLPELNRDQLKALAAALSEQPALVACPGCYPTATALALLPAFKAGMVDVQATVVVNAISGVSGAGRTPNAKSHFCSANEDLSAYSATTHRHTPEIEQTLSQAAGQPVQVSFTPVLAPLTRGLLSTVTVPLRSGILADDLWAAYDYAYGSEPFVHLLPAGSMPHASSVVGSNNAHVGIALDVRTGMLVASCAIDNLGKGAAAQAVQCANILYGLDEKTGLAALAAIV
jgi:N-acetyl-gamma-glutamyl-phosphate reductase